MSHKHQDASYARRCRVAAILLETPMATATLVERMGEDYKRISNDIAYLHKLGIVEQAGSELATASDGSKRARGIWKALRLLGKVVAEEAPPAIPDLPDSLLLLMGYTRHQPQGGVQIDNADYRPTYGIRKHRASIPSAMGMFEGVEA